MKEALVLPMATGMALRECLIVLQNSRPNARHVIWPRIDQKSCLKSMVSLGLTVHVIEPILKEMGSEKKKMFSCFRFLIDEFYLLYFAS